MTRHRLGDRRLVPRGITAAGDPRPGPDHVDPGIEASVRRWPSRRLHHPEPRAIHPAIGIHHHCHGDRELPVSPRLRQWELGTGGARVRDQCGAAIHVESDGWRSSRGRRGRRDGSDNGAGRELPHRERASSRRPPLASLDPGDGGTISVCRAADRGRSRPRRRSAPACVHGCAGRRRCRSRLHRGRRWKRDQRQVLEGVGAPGRWRGGGRSLAVQPVCRPAGQAEPHCVQDDAPHQSAARGDRHEDKMEGRRWELK